LGSNSSIEPASHFVPAPPSAPTSGPPVLLLVELDELVVEPLLELAFPDEEELVLSPLELDEVLSSSSPPPPVDDVELVVPVPLPASGVAVAGSLDEQAYIATAHAISEQGTRTAKRIPESCMN